MLVREHDINYNPSEQYKKSLKLRMEVENKHNQINEYLINIDVGKYDESYVNDCSEFKDYNSLDEYVGDIIICLMEVYPSYDEESSRYLVNIAMDRVKQSFEFR